MASEPVRPALRIVTGVPEAAEGDLKPPTTTEKSTRANPKRKRRVTVKNVAKVRQKHVLGNFDEMTAVFFASLKKGAADGDPRTIKMLGEMLGYLEGAANPGNTININNSNSLEQRNASVIVADDRGFENIVRKLENRRSSVQLTNADADAGIVPLVIEGKSEQRPIDIEEILREFTL